MRAYHMPSLPEIPVEEFHASNGITDVKQMKLKILYALDENTNFLARSSHTCKVKTARIPIPGQRDIMTLGVVSLKEVIYPVMQSSPELFSDPTSDYSVYVKDVSEEDEPYVGQGFVSNILSKGALGDEVLVPGRVCSNFVSLLSKGPSETLEVRLKMSRVNKAPLIAKPQQSLQPQMEQQTQTSPIRQGSTQSHQKLPQARESSVKAQVVLQQSSSTGKKRARDESADTEDESEDAHTARFAQPKPLLKKSAQRYTNPAPAPKAVRTQSLPSFDIARFPPQSIARRIYMADKQNNTYNFNAQNMEQSTNSPVENVTDVSKRFAPDFMTRKQKKPVAVGKGTRQGEKGTTQTPPQQSSEISQPPICFHCKTSESKSWRWNNSESEDKRGMMCFQCYQYLNTKGVMRPQRLIERQGQYKKRKQNAQTLSSPNSSDTVPTTTPNVNSDKSGNTTQYYSNNNSNTNSDALNEIDEMINSDLDFNLGPMTDIDPFPQPSTQAQFSDDKENIAPTDNQQQKSSGSKPISVRRASRQTSFEKMLAKSFSGVPPTQTAMSPSDWMVDLFSNTEPTPKDQDNVTPRDFDNTPRDPNTCNTLPCNDESPQDIRTTTQLNKLKVTTMPSSPLMEESRINTSPNSMNNSDWQQSESTHLSSQGPDDLPPKAHFQHDPSIGSNYGAAHH